MSNEQSQTLVTSSTRKWILIGAGVLVFVVIAIFSAFNAQPGGALYGLKGSLENLSSGQTNGPQAAQRQVSLMEKRLEEAKKLATKQNVSEKAVTDLLERMTSHFVSISEVVNQENSAPDEQLILSQINRFASIAGAIERIIENTPSLEAYTEQAEDIRRDSVNLHTDKIDRFVEKAPLDQIYSHIQAQLAEVSAQLSDPSVSADAIDDAQKYLDRIENQMKKSDFPKVIASIAEASRFIQIERYAELTTSNNISATPTEEMQESSMSPDLETTSTTTI